MVAGDIPGETQTASLAIYDAISANRDGDALGMIVVLTVAAVGVLYGASKLTRLPRVL
jgi:molybdate transport system permease protein